MLLRNLAESGFFIVDSLRQRIAESSPGFIGSSEFWPV
jgi:hypothetical protein